MTQEQADDAEVCQDRIALEQYQEGIVDLGKREILDIVGRLLVRAEKAEAALAEKSKECEALTQALEQFGDIARGLRKCRHGRTCCVENDNTVGAINEAVRVCAALTPRPDGQEK